MDDTSQTTTLLVTGTQAGDRIDRWLTAACPDLSRSAIKKLIDSEDVLLEGKPVRSSHRVAEGESVTVTVPPPEPLDLVAEDLPLDIVFEDDHLIVVNKAAGMVVHPARSLRSGTLVNALLGHSRLSSVNGDLRPGIVHRLDKDTSGLLVVAKDDVAHRTLSTRLEAREVQRQYLALCWGHPNEDPPTIDTKIGRHRQDRTKMAVVPDGRGAVTHYSVTARYDFLSRVEVRLETGRTHQIRVHFDHIGHPIFGDMVYNGHAKRLKGISPLYRSEANVMLKTANRQMLHAQKLGFRHPISNAELSFEAPPPDDFESILIRLDPSDTPLNK
jgi:23S rRNA pseudouridine1911/1915/1917 synthase